MSIDELAVLDGGKCILQLRGVRPFLSNKYDITKHPNYKYLSDADPRNAFKDFTGHSLSMSDVIVLKQHGEHTAHYVDAIGFKEVPEFIKPINPLRSIEDTVEQNDNQFDGLINNVPNKDVDKSREATEGHEEKKPQKESVKQRLKKSAEKPESSKTLPNKPAEMER